MGTMMSDMTIQYLWAALLGLIQGLTEFWPISSSGHLLLFHEFSDFLRDSSLTFDLALHFGTLLAIIVFFRKDLWRYLRAFFRSFVHWNLARDTDQRLAWYFLLASIPAGLTGLLFRELIVEVFRSAWVVVFTLGFFGVLFLLVEKKFIGKRGVNAVNLFDALFIGFAQAVSLIPGVSRSGITIIAGMTRGLKREESARFSFLMSVPIVLVAAVKELWDWYQTDFSTETLILAGIGFFVAFVSGLLAIRFLLSILRRYSLKPFAYYRIVLAILLFIFLLSR